MDFLKASHFLRKKGPPIIDASAVKSEIWPKNPVSYI